MTSAWPGYVCGVPGRPPRGNRYQSTLLSLNEKETAGWRPPFPVGWLAVGLGGEFADTDGLESEDVDDGPESEGDGEQVESRTEAADPFEPDGPLFLVWRIELGLRRILHRQLPALQQ